ncbi:hypothetical protein JYK14_28055 [Siccirubricoccus sp. KC 17139]|uniref:Uncharacterized protein n=1 Tax=Siccirubricoccus soli TaxID=2899147 RepID=A0ABT1DDG9_9PROT|nr:hypothetical protein [Siccirubricoccus soli]MCO6419988.1 hypothetical protein [Siccirubricoccus soli]MCP2686123.1 hypothetical protein [Siccirubricoccus soli]
MPTLPLGPFAVHRDGTLDTRAPDVRPALRFHWRGRNCEAGFSPRGLQLSTLAARVPSTAERAKDRPRAFATVAEMREALPEGWRLRLLADHSIRIETEAPFADPPTAVSLVASLVRFALEVEPYLDRLALGGTAAVGVAAAGTTASGT